jgi:hypothetical protein
VSVNTQLTDPDEDTLGWLQDADMPLGSPEVIFAVELEEALRPP